MLDAVQCAGDLPELSLDTEKSRRKKSLLG